MNLTIIGCGAFAQGIASLLQEKNKITMWVHDSKEIPNLKKVYPMITFEIKPF